MKTKRFSRVMAIVLSLVMVLGMMPLGAAAADSAQVVEWNVTLADDICPNFYLSLPEADKSTVEVTVDNGTAVSYTPDQLTQGEDGLYIVRTNLAAAQMADEIRLVILVDGEEAFSNTYTVAQYAASVLKNSKMSRFHDLVLNMLNYGAKAQLHFDHNADSDKLANVGHELEKVAAVPSGQEQILIEGAVEGISFYGASLLFQNKIAIRYYFSAPNGIEGYTFKVGETEYEADWEDGICYVQIGGINPQNYSEDVTLTISDSTGSQGISYSPMRYITRMYNKANTSETLKDLLAAMYGYHVAACELPDPTPEELGYTRFTLKELGIADGTHNSNQFTHKPVEGGLDMRYLDADVSFGSVIDASSGIKYGTTGGAWDGFRIGLVDSTTLCVAYPTNNVTQRTYTAEEAGVESFTQTFNLKVASKIEESEVPGTCNFKLSMWINDKMVMDHLLFGNVPTAAPGVGDNVGILLWNGATLDLMSQETPEEMGFTRYTMADLGYADGTYNGTYVRTAEVPGGIDGKYMDVDVAFKVTEDPYNGIKIANTGATSWDGLRVGLCGEDVLAVQHMVGAAPYIFKLTPAEAGVKTFTEKFNLKIAVELAPVENAPSYTIVMINMWINDRLVKKNVSTGGISGIGNFAGMMTWHENSNVTIATPVIEEIPEETVPDETVPEETVPEETVPEETVPEETVPAADPTPEELGFSRYTLAGLGVADGTYTALPAVGGENTEGLDGKYLDVDVSFTGAEVSSGIKVATTDNIWAGIRIGLAAEDRMAVTYAPTNLELKSFTAEEAGLSTFGETFNLKVATKITDSTSEGKKDVVLYIWINDKMVINHMLVGGISDIGNYAGVLSYSGASVTVASKPAPEELGYSRFTMAELGYADGTYLNDGTAVRTAEVSGGIDGKYLDVDVSFGDTVDGSSGIKIANTGVTSWDGIKIGLLDENTLEVKSMGGPGQQIFTLTAGEAGVESFAETFNLKFAVDFTPVEGNSAYTIVTINMWINDQLIKKNVSTGGIPGIGNFAGMLTWGGASVTVATPAEN